MNLNSTQIAQIVDAVADLPFVKTMRRVQPLMPKLRKLIVAHDAKLAAANESPRPPERYSRAHVDAAVKYCFRQREQGIETPFEEALELEEPEEPTKQPARYAAARQPAPAGPRYSKAVAVAAIKHCTRNPGASYARALEAFAAGRHP